MKKYFSIFSIAVALLSCSFVAIAEQPGRNPIVEVDKAIEFGIWRIHNTGDKIYIVDRGTVGFLRYIPTP